MSGSNDRPSAHGLWKQAGGGTPDYDQAEYRRLAIEHGLIVPLKPGEKAEPLPCGWPTRRVADDDEGLCGDCMEGRCHGGDPECCGCARHEASVEARS